MILEHLPAGVHTVSFLGTRGLNIVPSSLGSVLALCGLGFLLGVRHSTDADHVVAVSTIVSRQRTIRSAALIGSLWGVGHTVTIFVVGSLIILGNVRIPARLGLAMEFSVAVMLVTLGFLNLTGYLQRLSEAFIPPSGHAPGRSGGTETRLARLRGRVPRLGAGLGAFHGVRPFVVGLVHGLAGSAAVALLVLSTIRDPRWAAAYLLIFGAGTVAGMMLMTSAVAVPLALQSRRWSRLNDYLATASGVVSLCFGSFLMFQLGYVGGLFSRHPHWTPH